MKGQRGEEGCPVHPSLPIWVSAANSLGSRAQASWERILRGTHRTNKQRKNQWARRLVRERTEGLQI